MPGGGIEFACEKPKERGDDPEHVLKALQNMETNEEKLTALCKKYTELLEEHRTMQNTIKQSQRTISVLSREKDQLQSEHSKAVLAKSKLEGLCRELQRHNKLIKDESMARAKEDEEKRKEVSTRFQTTINEIQQQMNDHYQKNTSLREENLELANKLKGLIEQYEIREEHIEKILKTKEIEGQLYDAKLQQAALQIAEEKEKSLRDKQTLLQETMEAQKKITLLEEQEKQLKAQVTMYSDRYEEFQSTLTKSNEVFQGFKTEMEKMTKKIKKLEKETSLWRQKWESSNKALLAMAEEKALSNKETALLQNKISKLESLCRALQEERRKAGSGKGADVTSAKTQMETATSTPFSSPESAEALPSNSEAGDSSRGLSTVEAEEVVDAASKLNDSAPVQSEEVVVMKYSESSAKTTGKSFSEKSKEDGEDYRSADTTQELAKGEAITDLMQPKDSSSNELPQETCDSTL